MSVEEGACFITTRAYYCDPKIWSGVEPHKVSMTIDYCSPADNYTCVHFDRINAHVKT